MREWLNQCAPTRSSRGRWARAGLITLTVGTTFALGATVSVADEGGNSPSTTASDESAGVDRLEEVVVTARKRSRSEERRVGKEC